MCRSAVARISLVFRSVSDTWNVIPIVKAKYAKSAYWGGSSWLKSTPPAAPV